MRRTNILFSILSLVLLFVIAPSVLGQENEVAAPRIIATTPSLGEELALDQTLNFIFDRPMSTVSDENRFSVSPTQGGEWSWQDDRTLTFTPDIDGFKRDTAYSFNIFAVDADGMRMGDTYQLRLHSVGYLEITDVIPAPETQGISVDSDITIIFNRPVVPLVSIGEQADLPHPLEFEPAVEGSGMWINTSIYSFTPAEAFEGGADYFATVPAGLTSANGAILEEDFRFAFSTARPIVIGSSITPDSANIPLDTTLDISFSQAIDESTQNGVQLIAPDNSTVNVTYEWSEDGRTVTLTPNDLLNLESSYRIEVDRNIVRTVSGSQLENDYFSTFYTVRVLGVDYTYPSNGDSFADSYGGFRIYFTAPVDQATLTDKIVIDPEPARDYDSYYYSYDNSYGLFFDLEPSTDYTVRILPGIADAYGNTIDTETVIRFTTAALGPEITINAADIIGVYNGLVPSTRLFITHRNISAIDLTLSRLDVRTLAQILNPNNYNLRYDYQPSPDQVIRNWRVPVESELNERRYELLFLSEQGSSGVQNIQCVGAPSPRLAVGATAQVSFDDPTPTRVRTAPSLQGSIVTEYLPGVSFEIRGGPICADGYLWWQIYNPLDNTEGWMAEGTSGSYFLEPIALPPINPNANPENSLPALSPGVYFLSVQSPENAAQNYSPQTHTLIVSTANITMKYGVNEGMAWVTDMLNGQPLANVSVRLMNEDYATIASVTTNEDGIARFNLPRLQSLYTTIYAIVETDEHFGFTSSDFTNGIDPWRFEIVPDYQPSPDTVYLYTDRPIYRPDQPVYYRGIFRERTDVQFSAPTTATPLTVRIYNAENEVISEEQIFTNPFGDFSGEFMLDSDALLGYYRISVEVPMLPTDRYQREYSIGFNVAEYRAPEFLVDVIPAESEVVQGDTIQIAVESQFFFGGPVSNADVEWTVLGDNYFFDYDGAGYWSFFDYNYDDGPQSYYGQDRGRIAEGQGITDAEGRLLIELPAELGEQTQSQIYTIEARIVDESDQLVAGRTQVVIHQGEYYVGLQPNAYVFREGDEAEVNVITVDWDSDSVAARDVDYRVVERRWFSVQEEDQFGRTVWTRDVEEIEVATGTVTTDADGRAVVNFTPPNGGTYKIYAASRDDAGNTIQSSVFVWVSGREYIPWRQQNSNRIDLISNADEYQIGDTAEILIASPFQGAATALITVERSNILYTEVVQMPSNSYVYELEIEEIHAPNVFVSVIIVKGIDDNTPYTQFRAGLIQLNVETQRLEMILDVTPDIPEGVIPGPGDEITLNITATDWEGNPVVAEVGVGVTDLAILTLAPSNSSSLLQHFYGERGIGVRTATALTISVDQVTQTIIDTVKGGGGGGGGDGIFTVRQNFVDTPLWAPDVITDANGQAQITLTLPDNLTTWRIDARAVTRGFNDAMLVGQASTDFISTKPLLIRPVTPRFAVVGDEINMGTIVNNNTDETQEIEVFIQGSGFTLLDAEPTQTITLAAGERQRVNWLVSVEDVQFLDVFFAAQSTDGRYEDAARPAVGTGDERLLPVYRYATPETVGTSGVLNEDSTYTEIIALPPYIDPTRGDLTVQLDRSLAGTTRDGLDYLRNYRYQGIESTISRFLPNIVTVQALRSLGQPDVELEANLDAEVNFAIQRLYAQQKIDGGWGWFPADDSDPMMTAYAVMGLAEALNAGYDVDAQRLDRAIGFLNVWLTSTEGNVANGDSSLLNRRAFILYALTYADFGNESRLAALYNVQERLNLDARAFLTMALYQRDPSDARLATLESDLMNAAILSATGTHWEDRPDTRNWTTDTRTTAIVFMALTQINAANELLPGAVRWLLQARTADFWESTQETAWSVMSLTQWMIKTDDLNAAYDFAIALNSDTLLEGSSNSDNVTISEQAVVEVSDLLLDDVNRLSIQRGAGTGNLYYTAHITNYVNVDAVEPVARGIVINRQYLPMDDNTPVSEARVGDELQVTITIIAPQDLHYVVIEDPIPAGAEAVNPNLLTSSRIGERPELVRDDPFGRGWGWWWFSRTEFRDEAVVLFATYLPRGTYTYTYTLRMGLEGTYNVMPTTGQETFFPEVYGRSAGQLFVILPEED